MIAWTRPGMTGSAAAAATTVASRPATRLAVMNHRFDKLGQPLPLELHGCGCSLCARQQRALLRYWETR